MERRVQFCSASWYDTQPTCSIKVVIVVVAGTRKHVRSHTTASSSSLSSNMGCNKSVVIKGSRRAKERVMLHQRGGFNFQVSQFFCTQKLEPPPLVAIVRTVDANNASGQALVRVNRPERSRLSAVITHCVLWPFGLRFLGQPKGTNNDG